MKKRLFVFLISSVISMHSICLFATEQEKNAHSDANIGNVLNNEKDETKNTPYSSRSSHFTWGFEVGSSIDISGYDSSTINADALVGYKNAYIRFIGAGLGIHHAVGSGDNYVPLYLAFRSSFSSRPRLFFLSAKIGYSFNTIGDADTFGDINASLGWGINLTIAKKFQSYLILGYEFRHFNSKHRETVSIDTKNISMASLSLGFNF